MGKLIWLFRFVHKTKEESRAHPSSHYATNGLLRIFCFLHICKTSGKKLGVIFDFFKIEL